MVTINTSYRFLAIALFAADGEYHEILRGNSVPVSEGREQPVSVAKTPIGMFEMHETFVSYAGKYGSFELEFAVTDALEKEMVFTVISLMAYNSVPKGVLAEFYAWCAVNGVLPAYRDMPTCEWHQVSARLVHACVNMDRWTLRGVHADKSNHESSQTSSYCGRVGKTVAAVTRAVCSLPVVSGVMETLSEFVAAGAYVSEFDFCTAFDDAYVDHVVPTSYDVVREFERAMEPQQHDADDPVDEPAALGARVDEEEILVSGDRVPDRSELTSDETGPADLFGDGGGQKQVVETVGCVPHLYSVSEAFAALARTNAIRFCDDPGRYDRADDPLAYGFCYLLFYKQASRARAMEIASSPALDVVAYKALKSHQLELSTEEISFRFYGTNLHLSRAKNLPRRRAIDLFYAVEWMFSIGSIVEQYETDVASGRVSHDSLTVKLADLALGVRPSSIEKRSSHGFYSEKLVDPLDDPYGLLGPGGSERSVSHDRGKALVYAIGTGPASSSTVQHQRYDDPSSVKRTSFSTITIDREWHGRVIRDAVVSNDYLDTLTTFFERVEEWPKISDGTMNLCGKGLGAIEDYKVLTGTERSTPHAQLVRALRGVLGACFNDNEMWMFVFQGRDKFEKIFTNM